MGKTSLAKYIVGLALLTITGILASATLYYDAFTPFLKGLKTYNDYVLMGMSVILPCFVLFLFLTPAFIIIWDYFSEKYGKKQCLLNVCWLILCSTFAYFAAFFPNVLMKIGRLPDISEVSLQLYRLVIVFVALFLLCWLSHMVDYYKHLLEYLKMPMRKPRDENIVSAN